MKLIFAFLAFSLECGALRIEQVQANKTKQENKELQDWSQYQNPENPALDGWNGLDGSVARTLNAAKIKARGSDESHEKCTDANNRVMNRHDQFAGQATAHQDEMRHYTLLNQNLSDTSQKDCASILDLQNAMKHGKRVWIDANARGDDGESSKFVPYGCKIPHRTPDQVRAVLSRPALLSVVGDSLTRHMNLGLSLISTGDYYAGGIPMISRRSGRDTNSWERCTCDGQFSESLMCRRLVNIETVTKSYPKNKGGCSEVEGHRIFYAQAGAHLDSDVEKVLKFNYLPLIDKMQKKYAACLEKVSFLMVGMDSQSRLLDQPYPKQKREKAAQFNARLKEVLAEERNVHVVDFMPLTEDAQSSDGFHHLTDVNVAKAEHFVAMVDMISKQQVQ